jgi:hypothetical protein
MREKTDVSRRERMDGRLCRCGRAIALCLVAWHAAGCARVKVSKLTHRNIEGCVEVRAGRTRLVVVPAWAGRISVLDFGAGNVLWSDPKIDGRTLKPEEGWAPWDGNATDIVRSDGKRQWKGLWLHPWPKVKLLDNGVEIESEVSAEANLSAKRVYRLSPDGKMLAYNYLISSRDGSPMGWTIWERALVPAGGYAIAPVARGGAFPNGWIVRDDATVDPADRALTRGDFLVMRAGTKRGVGLAARLRAGWVASVREGHALLMTFWLAKEGKPEVLTTRPGGRRVIIHPEPQEVRYAHCNGAHVAFWLAPEQIELEPLSCEVTLDSGLSRSFTQVWHWLELPRSLSRDDPAAVGEWLEKQAADKARWLDVFNDQLFVIVYR